MYKYCVILFTFFLLQACVQVPVEPAKPQSQLAVSSVWDVTVSYPAGTTFSIKASYVEHPAITQEQLSEVYQLYAAKIKRLFTDKGYQYVEQGGKFTVEYGLALAEALSDKTINKKFGVTPGLQASEHLSKGSFLIAVEESESKIRVWRGAVQGFVQEDYSPEERERRITHVVSIVLAQFFSAQ